MAALGNMLMLFPEEAQSALRVHRDMPAPSPTTFHTVSGRCGEADASCARDVSVRGTTLGAHWAPAESGAQRKKQTRRQLRMGSLREGDTGPRCRQTRDRSGDTVIAICHGQLTTTTAMITGVWSPR